MLQKIPGGITFGSPGSSHSEIAAAIIGGHLAWYLPRFSNGNNFAVALSILTPSSRGAHRLDKVEDYKVARD